MCIRDSLAEHPGRVETDAVGLGDPCDEGDLALDPALALHAVRSLARAAAGDPAGDDRYAHAMSPAAGVSPPGGPAARRTSRFILPNLPKKSETVEVLVKLSSGNADSVK